MIARTAIIITALVLITNTQVHAQASRYTEKKAASKDTRHLLPAPSSVTQNFFKAINSGNLEIAEMLLNQGADINCRNCSSTGATALIITAMNPVSKNSPNPILVWLVERGANLNLQDKEGNTALIKAAAKGVNLWWSQEHDTLYLLSQGADAKIRNNEGENALHWLAASSPVHIGAGGWTMGDTVNMNKSFEALATKLASSGADINTAMKNGYTPLMVLAKRCNVDALRVFLALGANINVKSLNGTSALDIATQEAIYMGGRHCNAVVAELQNK